MFGQEQLGQWLYQCDGFGNDQYYWLLVLVFGDGGEYGQEYELFGGCVGCEQVYGQVVFFCELVIDYGGIEGGGGDVGSVVDNEFLQ